MTRIMKIRAGAVEVTAELNDSTAAAALYEKLPLEGTANTWGDEIYFEVPVSASLDETAREVVAMGDLGYWPAGRAFCVFFGPTPASRGNEIRPASAVNVLGRVAEDPTVLKAVKSGEAVYLERA